MVNKKKASKTCWPFANESLEDIQRVVDHCPVFIGVLIQRTITVAATVGRPLQTHRQVFGLAILDHVPEISRSQCSAFVTAIAMNNGLNAVKLLGSIKYFIVLNHNEKRAADSSGFEDNFSKGRADKKRADCRKDCCANNKDRSLRQRLHWNAFPCRRCRRLRSFEVCQTGRWMPNVFIP